MLKSQWVMLKGKMVEFHRIPAVAVIGDKSRNHEFVKKIK